MQIISMFPFLSPIAVAGTRSVFHCALSLTLLAFHEFPVALIF